MIKQVSLLSLLALSVACGGNVNHPGFIGPALDARPSFAGAAGSVDEAAAGKTETSAAGSQNSDAGAPSEVIDPIDEVAGSGGFAGAVVTNVAGSAGSQGGSAGALNVAGSGGMAGKAGSGGAAGSVSVAGGAGAAGSGGSVDVAGAPSVAGSGGAAPIEDTTCEWSDRDGSFDTTVVASSECASYSMINFANFSLVKGQTLPGKCQLTNDTLNVCVATLKYKCSEGFTSYDVTVDSHQDAFDGSKFSGEVSVTVNNACTAKYTFTATKK